MDEEVVNIETDTENIVETTSENVVNEEIPKKKEECKSCKANIAAAMLISICKEMAEKDGVQLDVDCKIMEKELTEMEEKVAPEIIEKLHDELMIKASDVDKETIDEIYSLYKE